MAESFDLVRQLHAEARRRGGRESVLQFDNPATQAQYQLAYAVTKRYVRAGDDVLDWGCGNGHFSFFLETLGACVTGYSFEPPPAIMRDSPRFQFVAGTPGAPSALPFPDDRFDAAMSVGVIEHVWETGGDEAASLRELFRVLEPGGLFLTFHLPNESGWIESMVRALRLNKHLHGRRYREAQIRRLWTSAGFEILEMGLYNALPRAELRMLPDALRRAEWFARAYNLADDLVASALPRACTNYFVVARKPA